MSDTRDDDKNYFCWLKNYLDNQMRLFPESAYIQLEFDKVKSLLAQHCRSEYAIAKGNELRIHTRIEFIETELRQTFEYKQLLQNSIYFPNDPVFNLSKELKMLSIPGAVLSGGEFIEIRKLRANEKCFQMV